MAATLLLAASFFTTLTEQGSCCFLLSKQIWLPHVNQLLFICTTFPLFLKAKCHTGHYNKDLAYVPAANASQKFSNEWMNTLFLLWVCYNPYTHPCFCDVFNYVSPGSGDSKLLITLLSSLEQNYSTKWESSWLTMQLVIPVMCQNYDAIYSLSLCFFFNSVVASSLNQISFLLCLLFSFPLSVLFISVMLLVMHCLIWDKKVISHILTSLCFICAGQTVYNLLKCLLCFNRNAGQKGRRRKKRFTFYLLIHSSHVFKMCIKQHKLLQLSLMLAFWLALLLARLLLVGLLGWAHMVRSDLICMLVSSRSPLGLACSS